MLIRLNKIHFPVTVLGFGRRIGIWTQGCSIGCPGCISRDTWPATEASLVDISQVIDFCRTVDGRIDGVTISGGEPFEQPEALAVLLEGLDTWRAGREIDFLCYSGLSRARLERDHAPILKRLDALIPEPFVRTLPGDRAWRGSGNQPLLAFTQLAQRRYQDHAEEPVKRGLQVVTEDNRFWMIGVPALGDIERWEEACRARGVELHEVSWKV